MHDIIKKALDEALTEKYYSELMECKDIDHAFSAGFVSEIKALIRKTDNKLIYYSKYIAVAACAILAIGCAVLVPTLLERDIDVAPPDTTTSVTETSAVTSTEPPADGGSDAADVDAAATTTTTMPAESTTVSETTATTTVTTTVTTTAAATPPETANTDNVTSVINDDDVNPGHGGPIDEEDDAEIEDDADYDTDGDEAADDDVADMEEDADDDAVIEDDGDDDVVIEDDEDDCVNGDVVTEDCDDENPASGGVPEFPEGNTLKEIYEIYTEAQFENTRVFSVSYSTDSYTKYIDGTIFDLTFVEDFIVSQGDAVRLDNPAEDKISDSTDYPADADVPVAVSDSETELKGEGRSIFVQLGEGELTNNVYFYDSSRRNNYGEFFRGEFSEDEDVAYEDDSFILLAGIEVYENGTAYYGNSVPMQFDPAATAELFERFDKVGLPDFTNSVDELIDYTEITENSIIGGVAKIKNVYDIGLSGVAIDAKEEIAGLYSIINSLRGQKCAPSWADGQIEIEFYVSETFSTIKLIVSDPYTDKPTLFIADDNYTYCVDITQKKAQEIISYICKCAGVAEPYFYVTAEEYLDYVGVKLENVKEITARGEIDGIVCVYKITAPEKIKKLTDMVLSQLGNTKYTGSSWSQSWIYADFKMDNWSLCLCEGYIRVGPYAASCFEVDGDVLTSVHEYIKENADETVMEDIEIEDEVDVDD